MSRTIGRHWPQSAPRGSYTARCDVCGVWWRRDELFRDAAGRWRCPDDAKGRNEVTLARGNAAAAARRYIIRPMDAPVPDARSYTASLPDNSAFKVLPKP